MTRVLSLDFGTGGVRAGVYDIDRRRMLATADRPYATTYPRLGWAEQQPDDWISAMVGAARDAIAKAPAANGTDADDIAAVAVATTASTVAVCDRNGRPTRPALLWMDCRAAEEARMTEAVKHPVMAYCGGGDAVEWLVPKAMWLARHEPDTYARAEVICEAIDFVNFHLTGKWVGSRMNAACKWNYDSAKATFVPDVYDTLGIADLISKLPQEIVPVGGAVGPLLPDMAARLGIGAKAIVAQGGIDAHIGILGADTVAVGGMLLIGGTSVVQLTQLAGLADVSEFWGPYPNALVDGLWLVEAGQVSAGSMLDWLSRKLFALDEGGHHALIREAATRRQDAGLLTLDYWMGNRTPYRDGTLRGAILGLSLGHDRADIYASAVDSIALGTANVLSVLGQRGVTIDRIVMAGGICRNALWLQATVDALGRPVEVAHEDNLSLVGTAVCSATALGLFPNLAAAAKACSVETRTVLPEPERSRWFARTLPLYREATAALTPTLHELARRQDAGDAR